VQVATVLALSTLAVPAWSAGEATPPAKAVTFAKGASAATVRGTLQGRGDASYRVNARAGQTLTVSLKSRNASLNVNVLPPGSTVAMFIGTTQGTDARLVLPTDGDYVLQVYLVRAAGRRGEQAGYTLDVGVTGQALRPLPGTQDAKLPGTPHHASASVRCQPPGPEAGGMCQAFVTRRGTDGTATVELRGANGLLRRVLFVKGQPVASDATEAITATRDGDRITVKVGNDESFEIVEAFLTGG
jgi:hypothetical protein